jgi:predicted oxidoreductase
MNDRGDRAQNAEIAHHEHAAAVRSKCRLSGPEAIDALLPRLQVDHIDLKNIPRADILAHPQKATKALDAATRPKTHKRAATGGMRRV